MIIDEFADLIMTGREIEGPTGGWPTGESLGYIL